MVLQRWHVPVSWVDYSSSTWRFPKRSDFTDSTTSMVHLVKRRVYIVSAQGFCDIAQSVTSSSVAAKAPTLYCTTNTVDRVRKLVSGETRILQKCIPILTALVWRARPASPSVALSWSSRMFRCPVFVFAEYLQALPDMLEVLPAGASKGHGVDVLLKHLGVDPVRLMALGASNPPSEVAIKPMRALANDKQVERAGRQARVVCGKATHVIIEK